MSGFACLIAALALGTVFASGATVTKVQFWFDTEDFTSDRSNDAIRDIANLLTEEGVVGHFNIAGYVAEFVNEKGRQDVIDALKPHLIGTQTMYHSLHPNLTEMTDREDYDEAYGLAYGIESAGTRALKRVFGHDRLYFSCYPGNGSSYVGLDVHADLGLPFHGGLGAFAGDYVEKGEFWWQNQRHLLYNSPVHLEDFLPGRFEHKDIDAALDKAARCAAVVMYMHPHMAVRMEHWDGPNYGKGNNVEFGKWIPPTLRPEADTQLYYRRLRTFVRRLKADPRFALTDCRKLLSEQKPRVAITRKDVPTIRRALEKELFCVSEPASWCVADCFQAAVAMLRGADRHEPGRVYGFLSAPEGVKVPVTLKAEDLRAAAKRMTLKRHLPPKIDVGGVSVGPADFLIAALEVLETGAERVTVRPREQLGDIASKMPNLAKFSHAGTWIYWPQFKDRYLSDRLRLQFWTLRFE